MQNPKQANLLNSLSKFIQEKENSDEFSGAILVAKNGKSIFEYVCGFANIEKQIPNNIETKFNLGSANKMFTAVAIAQLAQKGLLSFTAEVGKYLPQFQSREIKKVTIDQLLTHTSGLGHYLDDKEKFLKERENLRSISDFLNLFKDEKLKFKPGTKYEYSGNGYEVLGAIIESVSSKSYYDFVKENIFNVANMPNTDSYEIELASDPKNNIAIGYTKRGEDGEEKSIGERRDASFMSLVKGGAGGGGYSNCSDLLNFANALLGNRLLNPKMTKTILSPKVKEGTKGNQTKYYGYGFQIFDIKGVKRVGHPGRFAGVNVRFDMYPDLEYIVIVLSNYDPPSAYNIAEKATELLIY